MLDPQVSPEEIKSMEMELGLRAGLLSLQLFPNGGATDIVTLFRISVGTAVTWYGSCCEMPRHCLNILFSGGGPRAALVFRVGVSFESSLFFPPFSHSSQSLIGHVASVDVKQNDSFIY